MRHGCEREREREHGVADRGVRSNFKTFLSHVQYFR